MINFDKHTIRLGTGDVDINVLESPSGLPVLAFSNSDEELSMSGSQHVYGFRLCGKHRWPDHNPSQYPAVLFPG